MLDIFIQMTSYTVSASTNTNAVLKLKLTYTTHVETMKVTLVIESMADYAFTHAMWDLLLVLA